MNLAGCHSRISFIKVNPSSLLYPPMHGFAHMFSQKHNFTVIYGNNVLDNDLFNLCN